MAGVMARKDSRVETSDRKPQAVLALLLERGTPMTAVQVADALRAKGQPISERAARLYLMETNRAGFTRSLGCRRGRVLTDKGRAELSSSRVMRRVGFLSARIDRMTFAMNFDLPRRSGSVVVNVSLAERKAFESCMDEISQVFAKGYAMGRLAGLLASGARIGSLIVPPGQVGLCTVCSVTLNGVLLKHGIPTFSRFGGLIELDHGKATRFVDIICYDGTTVDPLEVFIRGGMTDYRGAIAKGCGRIGASYREFPVESRDLVQSLSANMDAIGLGALLELGQPGQPVLDVMPSDERIAAVVIGGLNPVSILAERGFRVHPSALSGLMEFNQLFPYEELPRRLRQL